MGGDPRPPVRPPSNARASTYPNTRSLVVRGTDKDLQIAADLVAFHNRDKGKPLPKLQVLRSFSLKHAEASDLDRIVRELGLPVRVVPYDEERALLAAGSDPAIQELAELIRELDVPEPKLDKGKTP